MMEQFQRKKLSFLGIFTFHIFFQEEDPEEDLEEDPPFLFFGFNQKEKKTGS